MQALNDVTVVSVLTANNGIVVIAASNGGNGTVQREPTAPTGGRFGDNSTGERFYRTSMMVFRSGVEILIRYGCA